MAVVKSMDRKTLTLILCGLMFVGERTHAQEAKEVGTLLVAHGGSDAWNANIVELAQQVHTGGPVAVSFLMGPAAPTHRFQEAVRQLVHDGAAAIVVVPVLVSSHSGHYEQLRYLAGLTDSLSTTMRQHLQHAGIERSDLAVPLCLTPAMDDAPEIARILEDRARALAASPSESALFILGHGPSDPEDYATWMHALRQLADSIQAATGFQDVKVGLLWDDAPPPVRAEAVLRIREIIRLQASLTARPVAVVPILVSRGAVSAEKVPQDLAGLPVVYQADGLAPHPLLARWVERRVAECHAGTAPAVPN